MPWVVYIAPFIPFIAMLPPAAAAIWIANRWLKTREGGSELRNEVIALREELQALRQAQSDTLERLDFAERMLTQMRERRELPPAS